MAAGRLSLTQSRLKELLSYDPETGIFIRLKANGKQSRWKAGTTSGSADKFGYRMVIVDGHRYFAHRLAWLYMTGSWPAEDLDHRDRDKANNRWANLREATDSQNLCNTGPRKDNKLGVKGVSWSKEKRKWCAQITPPGQKRLSLGRYDCVAHAVRAYRKAEAHYQGEFAPAR